jgi:hypothetical protein
VLCTDQDKVSGAKYNYHELQLRSRFALTPAGNGLHSSRLMEAVFLGAHPVWATAARRLRPLRPSSTHAPARLP